MKAALNETGACMPPLFFIQTDQAHPRQQRELPIAGTDRMTGAHASPLQVALPLKSKAGI